jgi:hypothetical protein
MKAAASALAAVLALVAVPGAAAKDFRPGDLRVCAAGRCVPITDQPVLDALSAFYYGSAAPVRVAAPTPRAPYVQLQFGNGYVTGVASGLHFDRFLSFGVNLGRFAPRTWYAIPARVAAEIARLAARVRPQPVPRDVLARSH